MAVTQRGGPTVDAARAKRSPSLAAQIEERVEGSHTYKRLEAAGAMGHLALGTARQIFRSPGEWMGDMAEAYSTYARRMTIPLVISMAAFSIAYPVFFYGGLLAALGVSERLTTAVYIATDREIGVWLTTMVLASVAGSAVAADLGSRKIREELDALAVLGVSVTRKLVVPRVVAMILLCPTMGFVALFFENVTTYYFGPLQLHYPLTLSLYNMFAGIYPSDLLAYVFKLAIFGGFVGIVSCQKGLSAEGGSEGVGRAVNQTVVITFFGSWLLNSLYNLAYLTQFPGVAIFHG